VEVCGAATARDGLAVLVTDLPVRPRFSRIYLYLDSVFVGTGLTPTWFFVTRPTPRVAQSLTPAFPMGQGSLFSLMVILRRLGA